MSERMSHAERNAVDPQVYAAADRACSHETYAACDSCLRRAVSMSHHPAGKGRTAPVCGDTPCNHVPAHVTLDEDKRVNPGDYA